MNMPIETETAEREMPMGKPTSAAKEDCVPLSSLALPGEEAKTETPAVGDIVSYNVEGTITRIEGDMAYVKKTSVNGEEVGQEEAESEPNEETDFANLQGMARSQPEV